MILFAAIFIVAVLPIAYQESIKLLDGKPRIPSPQDTKNFLKSYVPPKEDEFNLPIKSNVVNVETVPGHHEFARVYRKSSAEGKHPKGKQNPASSISKTEFQKHNFKSLKGEISPNVPGAHNFERVPGGFRRRGIPLRDMQDDFTNQQVTDNLRITRTKNPVSNEKSQVLSSKEVSDSKLQDLSKIDDIFKLEMHRIPLREIRDRLRNNLDQTMNSLIARQKNNRSGDKEDIDPLNYPIIQNADKMIDYDFIINRFE